MKPHAIFREGKLEGDPPYGSGVYAFYHGEELIYIGRSFGLRGRLKQHTLSPYLNNVVAIWKEIPYTEIAEFEKRAIRRFKPILNGLGKSRTIPLSIAVMRL